MEILGILLLAKPLSGDPSRTNGSHVLLQMPLGCKALAIMSMSGSALHFLLLLNIIMA